MLSFHASMARAVSLVVAATCCLTLCQATAVQAATTDLSESTTTLTLTSYWDMTLDEGHGHVFVSGGPSGTVIQVLDLAGNPVTTINAPGASGMALSSDGSTIYAALPSKNQIAAISTSTLQVTATYSTGAGTQPQWVAFSGGKAWFTTQTSLTIGEIDPATGTVTSSTARSFYYGDRLFASPVAPGILVDVTNNDSPNTATVYDVSGSTPASVANSIGQTFCSGAGGDVAFTPDGADLIFACAGTQNGVEVGLRTLRVVRYYSTGAYPTSVAISPSGEIAIGVELVNNGIDVFDAGNTSAAAFHGETGSPVGEAWNSLGTLYAVVAGAQHYTLHLFRSPVTLSLTSPMNSASHGTALNFTGSLTETSPIGQGQLVNVSRVDALNPSGVRIGTAAVASDGSFSFVTPAAVLGTDVYTFTFPGTASLGTSSMSATIWVHPPVYPWTAGRRTPVAARSAGSVGLGGSAGWGGTAPVSAAAGASAVGSGGPLGRSLTLAGSQSDAPATHSSQIVSLSSDRSGVATAHPCNAPAQWMRLPSLSDGGLGGVTHPSLPVELVGCVGGGVDPLKQLL